MMRRVGDRLRASWTTLLRGELEDVRDELTTSLTGSFDELRRDIVAERDLAETRAAVHDTEMVNAFHRVAGAFESIAASLEFDRRDRREQLDAVEFLLREMVLGFALPTAANPSVLGGSIDPGALGVGASDPHGNGVVDIDLTHLPIDVDTPVEVRSRFHDRWVLGFAVSEYVVGSDRRGYRLRRRSEPNPLPLLFDEGDVRPATLPSDLPLPAPADDANHSMWR